MPIAATYLPDKNRLRDQAKECGAGPGGEKTVVERGARRVPTVHKPGGLGRGVDGGARGGRGAGGVPGDGGRGQGGYRGGDHGGAVTADTGDAAAHGLGDSGEQRGAD